MKNKCGNPATHDKRREQGTALIMALLVALILALMGMGLLLQTSLGQQAASVDRSVVKALYAANAGVWMQVQMVQEGQVVGPSSHFVLAEDPELKGFFRGEYKVTVTTFCEIEPPSYILGFEPEYRRRSVHIRSEAEREVGVFGTARAVVEADVMVWPFHEKNYKPMPTCS